MLTRIKWSDEIAGQKKEISRTKNEDGERNDCTLVINFNLYLKCDYIF